MIRLIPGILIFHSTSVRNLDLLKLLKKEPELLKFFNGLSYTHRKEYVRWIIEARREETRPAL
jgi:uncharacterized protein YdeI (YjbR/CyaY-like superfamily)